MCFFASQASFFAYRRHRQEITAKSTEPSSSELTTTSFPPLLATATATITNHLTSDELQHDIHQLLVVDVFEQKKNSSIFLLQLKEERVVLQATINDVVKGCRDVFGHTVGRIQAGVKYKLSESGIDPFTVPGLEEFFSTVNNPFSGLETSYLQEKFISEKLSYVVSPRKLLLIIIFTTLFLKLQEGLEIKVFRTQDIRGGRLLSMIHFIMCQFWKALNNSWNFPASEHISKEAFHQSKCFVMCLMAVLLKLIHFFKLIRMAWKL